MHGIPFCTFKSSSGGALASPNPTVRCKRLLSSATDISALPRTATSAHLDDTHLLLSRVGVLAAATATCAAVVLGCPSAASSVTNEQLTYLEAWRAIDRAYVDKTFNGQSWFRVRETALKREPMTDRQQTYDAIRRMVALLDDPFTRFLEPQRYAAMRRGNAGTLTGVGIEVGYSSDGKTLVVVAPAAGGPADRGGVRPGDRIISVDGRPAADMSLYDIGPLLQGEPDTQVVLSLQSPEDGEPKTREVRLTRQAVTFNPVSSELCSRVGAGEVNGRLVDTTGYIRVATFSKQTPDGFRTALKSLLKDGAQRLVVDIRNNGGGSFPAGIQVTKMLLNSGDIVLIADSVGVRDSYEADGTALAPDLPLVLLVNRGTASASEVFASALQDNNRAVIAGDRTFGKGLIQTVVELSDGSALAITVSRYQTPNGVDINKAGIKPDIRLDDGALPQPGAATGFCAAFDSAQAPNLFG